MTKGGKNLTVLALSAIAIAVSTTSIAIAIYHNSGDIYLDRSRPGFIPDEKENEKEKEKSDYSFTKEGEINEEVLDEYLEKIQQKINEIDELENPFVTDALSDEALGI